MEYSILLSGFMEPTYHMPRVNETAPGSVRVCVYEYVLVCVCVWGGGGTFGLPCRQIVSAAARNSNQLRECFRIKKKSFKKKIKW